MNRPTSFQLSFSQYVFIIYKTQIGIGVLTLPRDVAGLAGTDGWISVFIGWMVSILAGIVIVKVMQMHPGDTIYELLPKVFGKWIGNGLSLIWAFLFLFKAAAVFFVILYIYRIWVLPYTPSYLLGALFFIPVVMSVWNGLQGIARFADFIYLATIWMAPMLVFSLQENAEWLNLLPVLQEGWGPVLAGVKATLLSFLGFELAFILYPFLKNKKVAVKGIVIANSLTLFIYLLATVFSFVRFSPEEVKSFVWPTFILLKPIQFPFLERLEIIFISFYLFVLLFTVISYLYVALIGFVGMGGLRNYRPFLWMVTGLGFLLLLFFEPSHTAFVRLQQWTGNLGVIPAFIVPPLLWLISWGMSARKRRVAA